MAISDKWDEDEFTLIKTGKGKSFYEMDAEEKPEPDELPV
jgi:hypothetical protein